jgi:hypothetical protein
MLVLSLSKDIETKSARLCHSGGQSHFSSKREIAALLTLARNDLVILSLRRFLDDDPDISGEACPIMSIRRVISFFKQKRDCRATRTVYPAESGTRNDLILLSLRGFLSNNLDAGREKQSDNTGI